jgi:glycosyltransferase involved in cell wall biosynthesis
MPYFSIIIPVYNVAPYLRKCLDSVLSQTFTDWEAICVDDGSTDGSGAILDEYAAKDKRFRVIHQDNQGVAVARQVALDNIIGDWMIAIDPDDWVESSNLMDLYNTVTDTDVDMVWCNYYIDKNGKTILQNTCGENDSNNHLEMLLTGKIMGALWNHLLSRRFILEHNVHFPPKGCDMAEDLYFICDFLSYKPRIRWSNIANYHYCFHDNSLLRKKTSCRIFLMIKITEKLIEKLQGRVDDKLLLYVKEGLKFFLYDKKEISVSFFLDVYPDVRNISLTTISWWHKILFWLSIRGWRSCVILFLILVRRCKEHAKNNLYL